MVHIFIYRFSHGGRHAAVACSVMAILVSPIYSGPAELAPITQKLLFHLFLATFPDLHVVSLSVFSCGSVAEFTEPEQKTAESVLCSLSFKDFPNSNLLVTPPNSEYDPDKRMGAVLSDRTHHLTDYCYISWTTDSIILTESSGQAA